MPSQDGLLCFGWSGENGMSVMCIVFSSVWAGFFAEQGLCSISMTPWANGLVRDLKDSK